MSSYDHVKWGEIKLAPWDIMRGVFLPTMAANKLTRSLPIEIWRIVLCLYVPRLDLMRVCQTFRTALLDMSHLNIKPNNKVVMIGLMKIIKRFPLLKSLTIQHCRTERLMHQVCSQFEGLRLIESIEASSDFIVPGAFRSPNLRKLCLGYQSSTTGVLFEANQSSWDRNREILQPHKRRDIAVILDNFQKLEYLEIDNPLLWSDHFVKGVYSLCIKKIKLTSLSQAALDCLINSFRTSKCALLPTLTEFYLDMDYSVLEENSIRYLSQSCPKLEKLRMKFAVVSDSFFKEICLFLPKLNSFKLTNCQLNYISQSWSHVVKYLAYNMIDLKSLSLSYCTLNYIDDPNGIYSSVPPIDIHHTKMRSLKIFDISESRPDACVLHQLIHIFSNLTSLRMDLSADCFPPTDDSFLQIIRKNFRNLKRLETRFFIWCLTWQVFERKEVSRKKRNLC